MKSPSQPWYISQRAENLAIVLFTRFGDVHVDRASKDEGFDLRILVDIRKPHAGWFGVCVEGRVGSDILNEDWSSAYLRAKRRRIHTDGIPVGLLVFDVAKDRGLFGWLRPPAVDAQLTWADVVSLKPATNQRIEDVLSEFRRWNEIRCSANGKGKSNPRKLSA